MNFRLANTDDILHIKEIGKKCFPLSIRWRYPDNAIVLWLGTLLNSSAVETWLAVNDGEVQGFCSLITDEKVCSREKLESERKIPRHVKFVTLLRYFGLVIFYLIKKKRSEKIKPENVIYSNVMPSIDERIWIEYVAVAPEFRRMGVSQKMLSFCETRAGELVRAGIVLNVDVINNAAIKCYEKAGFVLVKRNSGQYTYCKSLESCFPGTT